MNSKITFKNETPHFFIGICGYPNSGKTTFANFLCKLSDKMSILDDGRPLRDAAKAMFKLTEEDVNTQEGKAREIDVLGKKVTVRQILGDLGEDMENRYGDHIFPYLTYLRAKETANPLILIFPSVRKRQGHFIRAMGGMMIEIVRDGCKAVYNFDRYDQSAITTTVTNNGTTRDLYRSAEMVLQLVKERLI